MSNPTLWTHVKWQVTAGNDWEESIKALEKLVRRISCMYNEKKKPATKQDHRAFGLSPAHVLTVVKRHLQLVRAGWEKELRCGVAHDMYSNLNTSKNPTSVWGKTDGRMSSVAWVLVFMLFRGEPQKEVRLSKCNTLQIKSKFMNQVWLLKRGNSSDLMQAM